MRAFLHRPALAGEALTPLLQAFEHAGIEFVSPDQDNAELFVAEGLASGAPDTVGPPRCDDLSIPYVLADPVPANEETIRACISRASRIVTTNAAHADALRSLVSDESVLTALPPLIDAEPYIASARNRDFIRTSLAGRFQFPLATPWLVTCAPMNDAAMRSYEALALMLSRMPQLDWRMAIAADGPRHDEVASLFGNVSHERWRIWRDAGHADRVALLVAADAYVWPGFGGAGLDGLLQAQAAGLAVVANSAPGVDERVLDGVTGRVALADNQASFMNCVGFLLRQPRFRESYGKAAAEVVMKRHSIQAASVALAHKPFVVD